jgi:hypothetical protein
MGDRLTTTKNLQFVWRLFVDAGGRKTSSAAQSLESLL